MAWFISLGLLYAAFSMWLSQGRKGILCALGITAVFAVGISVAWLLEGQIPPQMQPMAELLLVFLSVISVVGILLYWGPRFKRID